MRSSSILFYTVGLTTSKSGIYIYMFRTYHVDGYYLLCPRCGEMLALRLLDAQKPHQTKSDEPVFMTTCKLVPVVVWGLKSGSFTFQWPYMYIMSQRYFRDRFIFATIGCRKRTVTGASTFAKCFSANKIPQIGLN